MDIRRLLRDYNINFITEGNKHCSDGWVNIHCPFCEGSRDYHLGIHEDGRGAHCWRCGIKKPVEILSRLLNLPEANIRAIMSKYQSNTSIIKRTEPKVSILPLRMPRPNSVLTTPYRNYLIKRKFDPDKLEREWNIRQTGPVSFLDDISYSHRILIPIYWNGEMVSFQARDITGKSKLKYLACPKRREKIHHKNILYGKQEKWREGKGLIIVEGVTDVWRLGYHAVATFGIQFKMEQVLQLAKIHDKFFILFDEEPQAQEQARVLATKLKALGKEVYIEKIKGDPGDMRQEDADYLVKQLMK